MINMLPAGMTAGTGVPTSGGGASSTFATISTIERPGSTPARWLRGMTRVAPVVGREIGDRVDRVAHEWWARMAEDLRPQLIVGVQRLDVLTGLQIQRHRWRQQVTGADDVLDDRPHHAICRELPEHRSAADQVLDLYRLEPAEAIGSRPGVEFDDESVNRLAHRAHGVGL
jgi:hypothetical protein